MKIIGIIAEYNPFHNGHLYHLQEAQKELLLQMVLYVSLAEIFCNGENRHSLINGHEQKWLCKTE